MCREHHFRIGKEIERDKKREKMYIYVHTYCILQKNSNSQLKQKLLLLDINVWMQTRLYFRKENSRFPLEGLTFVGTVVYKYKASNICLKFQCQVDENLLKETLDLLKSKQDNTTTSNMNISFFNEKKCCSCSSYSNSQHTAYYMNTKTQRVCRYLWFYWWCP